MLGTIVNVVSVLISGVTTLVLISALELIISPLLALILPDAVI